MNKKRFLTILLVFVLALPMFLSGIREIAAATITNYSYDATGDTTTFKLDGVNKSLGGYYSLEDLESRYGSSDESDKESTPKRKVTSAVFDPAEGKTTVRFSDGTTTTLDGEFDVETAQAEINKLDAGDGDDGGKKSAAQTFFENVILSQVLNMNIGEESGAISTVTLLNRTFVYAVAIMEGADKAPSGYLGEEGLGDSLSGYDGIVHETWYLFLEVAAMLIMLIRFASDYSLDRVWQPTERNTPEQLFKPIFRLIVGFIFILCVHHFLSLGLILSQAAFSVISKSSMSAESVSLYNDMAANICELLGFTTDSLVHMPANITALVGGIIEFFIPFIISGISALGIIFVVFSRVLELVVRAVFAPLAMTDCYKSGENTHGFRYIMEFFGIAFQSLAIFAVLWVSTLVCGMFTASLKASGATDLNAAHQLAIYIAGLKLAQLVMLMKTSSITKSVFS